jgi:hypothetical protein
MATQAPARFQIRRLTRFQPPLAATVLQDAHLEALLRARAQGGKAAAWAEVFLEVMDPARVQAIAQRLQGAGG